MIDLIFFFFGHSDELCPEPTGPCDFGWTVFGSLCFKPFLQSVVSSKAEEECKAVGAYLSTGNSSESDSADAMMETVNRDYPEYRWVPCISHCMAELIQYNPGTTMDLTFSFKPWNDFPSFPLCTDCDTS